MVLRDNFYISMYKIKKKLGLMLVMVDHVVQPVKLGLMSAVVDYVVLPVKLDVVLVVVDHVVPPMKLDVMLVVVFIIMEIIEKVNTNNIICR